MVSAVENFDTTQVLTLDRALDIQVSYLANNPYYCGAGYKIIGNTIRNHRARGMLLKADFGLIQNNTVDGSTMHGIRITPEGYGWGEADYCWHITVVGNTVKNTGINGAIVVSGDGAQGNLDITIKNNIVSDCSGVNILVEDARDVNIVGNTCVNTHQNYHGWGTDPTAVIWLNRCTNVTLSENLVSNMGPYGKHLAAATASAENVKGLQSGIFLADTSMFTLVNQFSGLVLDDPVGTEMIQWPSSGAANQHWTINTVNDAGYCTLVCVANGLVLGVNGSPDPDAPLVLESYTGSDGQLWRLATCGNTYNALVNKLSGLAADVQTTAAGEVVAQRTDTGSIDQQWRLLRLPTELTAIAGNNRVRLNWKACSIPSNYNVKRSTSAGGPYSQVNTSPMVACSYVDAGLTNGIAYYYVVTAVDTFSNESAYSNETSATPTAGAGSDGLLREWWEGIGGGAVSDLTSNPDNPTGSSEPTIFEAPTDWADNYGTRMRGYLHPVDSGSYTFWIASDDSSELWLSTDDNPANAVKIAYVLGYTAPREWTHSSSLISLTGGQTYYIEALQKEGGGGDHLAVAWQGPGISQDVIDGSYLSPWVTGGDTTPPAAPTGLTATPGDAQVSLDWADNAGPDLASYNVKRATTTGGPYNQIASDVALSAYTDNTAVNGTTYYYVVTAVDTSSNESGYSNEDSATPTDTTPPAAPTGLAATAGDATVSLDWNDNGEGDLDGYNVYRSTTSGSGYSQLNGSLLSSSDYTDNSVSNGTTYYYVVTAVDTSNNESGYSNEASATPSGGGGVAMLYQHCDYGGWSAGFDVGSYTTSDIVAAGGIDNDASSLTVQSGYKVTLYDGDNFTGSSLVLTSDTSCFVDYGFNDMLSSMTIAIDEPDTTPPAAPTGLSATAGDATVSLDWNDNGEGDLDGYNVYRSTTPSGGYSQLNGSLLSSSD